ncbi:sensor histidine kinase [Chloroflexi bacterium TSY]|nr:sensor histidine kinase [Chloroflexi bacterium TSY]
MTVHRLMPKSLTGRVQALLYGFMFASVIAAAAVVLRIDQPAGDVWPLWGLLFFFIVALGVSRMHLSPVQITTLLTLLTVSAALGTFREEVLNLLFIPTTILAVTLLSPRQGMIWVILAALINLGLQLYQNNYSLQGLQDGVVTGMLLFFLSGLASLLRYAAVAHRRSQQLLGELQEAHQQLREYADQVEELAVSEERNRLARDLHDTMGHRLTASVVQLEAAECIVTDEPERVVQMMTAVRKQLSEGLGELRRTVTMLHTPDEADFSLSVALEQLARDFSRATALQIQVTVPDNPPSLSEKVGLILYRVAQEALTNVQRHAHAHEVNLALQISSQRIRLCVTDDGVGFSPEAETSGFGLRSIRERATTLEGKVVLTAKVGQGTFLCFELPYEQGKTNGIIQSNDPHPAG